MMRVMVFKIPAEHILQAGNHDIGTERGGVAFAVTNDIAVRYKLYENEIATAGMGRWIADDKRLKIGDFHVIGSPPLFTCNQFQEKTPLVNSLPFDTGGTILDWHTGFREALERAGKNHGIDRDWVAITNELRKRSLMAMLNLGEKEHPAYTFDDAHRFTLEALCGEYELPFDEDELHAIAYKAPHSFVCWPDFPAVLPKFRQRYMVCSFTILSYRIIIDTARRNGLSWDAVFSCEGIGKYKVLPESYQTVARRLQLEVSEICMVACHNFDLDAAKGVGFKTAFVKRPDEWGPVGPPDPEPNSHHDIIVETFTDLANTLDV